MNYWQTVVEEALSEVGIKATEEQITELSSLIEGAYENHDLATGVEVINANYESPEALELKEIKRKQEERRQWELSTEPCSDCITTGVIVDDWGRDVTCPNCRGEGRNRARG